MSFCCGIEQVSFGTSQAQLEGRIGLVVQKYTRHSEACLMELRLEESALQQCGPRGNSSAHPFRTASDGGFPTVGDADLICWTGHHSRELTGVEEESACIDSAVSRTFSNPL